MKKDIGYFWNACIREAIAYLPISVKMATPSASSPRITPGMLMPNADKP